MNAAERLRDALENSSILNDDSTFQDEEHLIVLRDAARNIVLPILEADPELVERIANCLRNYVVQVDTDRAWILFARAVLAAISTPTPGAE